MVLYGSVAWAALTIRAIPCSGSEAPETPLQTLFFLAGEENHKTGRAGGFTVMADK